MEKRFHKRQVVKRPLPNPDPERLSLYAPEFHVEDVRRGGVPNWRESVDPPIRDVIFALHDEVPCIEKTTWSCAGKSHETDPRESLKDPDFGRKYTCGAYFVAVFRTDDENLEVAQAFEDALTSDVFAFGEGENSFRGKIACSTARKHNISERPRRHYFFAYDKPPTAGMIDALWDVVREKIEPFKEK
ncbi:MAG: hypothetical protein ABH851_05650 [Methanobacteriota archaeon]